METIIYTNSKREAASYEVDKVYYQIYHRCFTDRVDVGQLIEDQMNRYNIRHLNFWFINGNISHLEGTNQEKILITTGKYFSENKEMTFIFEYLVEKYLPTESRSKNINDEENSLKISRKLSNMSTIKEESFSDLSNKMRESQESSKSSTMKTGFMKQQIVRQQLKFHNFQDFQTFITKNHHRNVQSDMIKTYIFKTNSQILKISFIQPNRRDFLKKIIDYDYDRVYDAKLHLKKKFTFHLDDYSSKHYQMMPTMATFHNKLILFLFQSQKSDLGKKKTVFSKFKPNLSLQALEQWKIKEENIDNISKLERECELIKQEIQSERLIFRNKIRSIENFIGQTINVEKLMQEEESDDSNKFQPSQTSFNSSFKKTESFKRSSVLQNQNNQTFTTVTKFIMSNLQNTSEFKRLKDISDAMRSIDNTLAEQNKKIEGGQKKLKDLIKYQQTLIYSKACQFNKIKAAILEDQSQIKRKEMEIEEKRKNGIFNQILLLKNKQPSSQAKLTLQQHKIFINQHKNSQGIQSTVSLNQLQCSTQKQKSNQQYRIVNKHKSEHIRQRENVNATRMNSLLKLRDKKMKEIECSYRQHQNQNKQNKMLKKTKIKPFQRRKPAQKDVDELETQAPIEQNILNSKLFEQLLHLYEYYQNNEKLMKKAIDEIENFKLIQQTPINTIYQSVKGAAQSKKLNSEIFSIEKLDLDQFPLLKEYLYHRSSGEKEENKTLKNSRAFKEEIQYPSNYFDVMMNLSSTAKQENVSVCKIKHKTMSSFGSEEIDNVISTKAQNNLLGTPSVKLSSSKINSSDIGFRHKRITIQEAITLNSTQQRLSKIK